MTSMGNKTLKTELNIYKNNKMKKECTIHVHIWLAGTCTNWPAELQSGKSGLIGTFEIVK